MSEPRPRFSSLSELLASITDKPLDEAKREAEAEFSIASDCVERIRGVPKAKRSQTDWNLVDYFDILRVLLNAMDGDWFSDGVSNSHTRKLIQEALNKWSHK
jgi:hypothetical protein